VIADLLALIEELKEQPEGVPAEEVCDGPIEIRECPVSVVLSSNTAGLLAEYAAESSISGMPPINTDSKTYIAMERSGCLQAIGAFKGDKLIGVIVLLTSVLPHYSALTTVTESFFVMKKYRKGGLGLKLLKAGEQYARDRGAVGMLVSAPAGGNLERVAPRMGYQHSNTIFFKGFRDE
jgi:GNAT superfamily N-acetyltransferase